eukprot:TRINITY_DN3049_c0_g3_i1.p1 TRINITY_DN3049_c0_g3~~TRINITY_DN3049_c0_g3_i1.p1  ORF type:complete len:156 (-),score=23.94 TRINITY_DN3049_c0_g3_i1:145-612(-)
MANRLLVRNLQRIVPLRLDILRQQAEITRKVLDIQDYGFSVICTTNTHMKQMNSMYRNKSKPTDVLTFPVRETATIGRPSDPEVDDPEFYNLGDIYLGFPYVPQACLQYGWKLEQRCGRLIVHGCCHLLGYTHDTESYDTSQFSNEYAQIFRWPM